MSARQGSTARWAACIAAGLLLALLPLAAGASVVDKLTGLFILMLLAAMWGLMAGQAGLVSVGQQAFFGLGAYVALRLVDGGLPAYPALLAGALGAVGVAWVLSVFLLRLKDGEFAIATWVVAEVIRILVMLDPLVQGETGTSLIALNAVEPVLRRNIGYWFALGALAAMLLAVWWLLRSPVGTATRALGDDDEAAAALGVRVMPTRRAIYLLGAFGCALAGVAWLASAITFLPRTNFGVQWSVLMLFMVLVGGLRSMAGPLVGALLLFGLQEIVGHLGAWYLAGLGGVAAACALWLPQGLVGLWQQRQARTATERPSLPSPPTPRRTTP
ncbi:branched-chain amino acid ABC transporter permease [Pseudaquabacterium pictum]|uniref:Branched-chain amino acid ABC transporter permease n=1 Tax=Pseudaquabacterium pictum TaxID=2315236 RepID=A0A480AKF5_9BURK|nr:branched-chain amino acid ABC transporter permease [Rubrivivax pictus]GCL62094.1 branched-chain amino acid ABC transporter permease [Rubrivivax pictus]